MHSELHISQADRRPMYLQIMEQIRHRIAVGDWPPGSEIPSIRALAAATRVSVITVKRAFDDLEKEGVLVTRPGRGTFVSDEVNLSANLREDELTAHLQAAVSVATQMGLTAEELEARWKQALESGKGGKS
jgi:GntR family transcriptional regulator